MEGIVNQKDRNELLAASLRLKPVGTPSAEIKESDATREFLETINTGHPGGKTSFAQLGAMDFSADEVAAMLRNTKGRVFKPSK
jgi:Flp pilus assembly CpaF family ATPase